MVITVAISLKLLKNITLQSNDTLKYVLVILNINHDFLGKSIAGQS